MEWEPNRANNTYFLKSFETSVFVLFGFYFIIINLTLPSSYTWREIRKMWNPKNCSESTKIRGYFEQMGV